VLMCELDEVKVGMMTRNGGLGGGGEREATLAAADGVNKTAPGEVFLFEDPVEIVRRSRS
jgi:Tfp pilus assembly pilus retraction ATPase PilT